jgi:hypothetical protein
LVAAELAVLVQEVHQVLRELTVQIVYSQLLPPQAVAAVAVDIA